MNRSNFSTEVIQTELGPMFVHNWSAPVPEFEQVLIGGDAEPGGILLKGSILLEVDYRPHNFYQLKSVSRIHSAENIFENAWDSFDKSEGR